MNKFIKASIMSLCLCCVPTVVHADNSEINTTSNISTGNVNISVKIVDTKSGEEKDAEESTKVIPSNLIDRTAEITNNGNEAWIRLDMSFETNDELRNFLDEDELQPKFESEDWFLAKDGYYYYKNPVDTKETVDFNKVVRVPIDWTLADTAKQFQLVWNVDAVQTANFEPNFAADEPWYGTVIEASTKTGAGNTETSNQAFKVEFKGGAEGLTTNTNDFFSDWDCFMPGDSKSDEITFTNSYNKEVKIWFSSLSTIDDELASHLNVMIVSGGKVIFQDTLANAITEQMVADLKPNETTKLVYNVSMPSALGNDYALKDTSTTWTFRAEVIEPASAVNTGDTSQIVIYATVCGAALLGLIAILVAKGKSKSKGGETK